MRIFTRTIEAREIQGELIREGLDSFLPQEYCAFVSEVSRRDRRGVQCIFQYRADGKAPMFAKYVDDYITDRQG